MRVLSVSLLAYQYTINQILKFIVYNNTFYHQTLKADEENLIKPQTGIKTKPQGEPRMRDPSPCRHAISVASTEHYNMTCIRVQRYENMRAESRNQMGIQVRIPGNSVLVYHGVSPSCLHDLCVQRRSMPIGDSGV